MKSFNELNLKPEIQRAVTELGFTVPSPIQAQTLPILLNEETDFIGLAATGTGKTAAFTLPLLGRIDTTHRGVQAIILCPTRELSMQVAGQVNILGKYLDIKALPIYGGAGYGEQLHGLKKGLPIVVGTPGRIIDHIEKGTLKLDSVSTIILDEADEMISMGFREDMERIIGEVKNEDRKTWLFSATMSPQVRKVADRFLKSPKQVQVNRTETLSTTVEQKYYMTREGNKPEVLCKLIDAAEDFYGVVFCQTKSLVVDLTRYLTERGYKADSLHGDMSQPAREAAIGAFRQKRKKIIVCTDVAARGLDVKDVTHVVNYSLPREIDSYVHRIGRTARAGKAGIAMALVTPSHRHLIGKIESVTRSRLTEGVVPSRKEIGMKKVSLHLAQFLEQPQFQRALDIMDEDWQACLAEMTPFEVAARFLTMQFPNIFTDAELPAMSRSDKLSSDERNDGRERREFRGGGRGNHRRFKSDGGGRGDRRRNEDQSRRRHRDDNPGRPDDSQQSRREDTSPSSTKSFGAKKFSDKKFEGKKFGNKKFDGGFRGKKHSKSPRREDRA